jgi:hypothetical protein
MLTCRKFAQILSLGHLFETINVGRLGYNPSIREKSQDAVIEKSKRDPLYGKKCKRLLIGTGIDTFFNITNLATTFPNLSFFHITQDLICLPPAGYTQFDPFEGWKNNLETLIINTSSMFSPKSILSQGVFNRLTTINVKVNNRFPVHFSICDIFPVLCNAPALASLRIGECIIYITNLEMLHSNALQLTSLTIVNGTFCGPVNLQLLDIKPTEKMEILNITSAHRDCIGRDSLVEYIKLKYNHLNQFLFSESRNSTNMNENEELIDLISAIGPRLEVCRIKLTPKEPQLAILLASLSTQLKVLGIYNESFDGSIYRIIQDPLLTSVTSLSLHYKNGSFKLSGLKALTQLKELRLNSQSEKSTINISLNSIVTDLPKGINSLSLKNASIVIDELELDAQSNISCLELYDSVMNDTDTSKFLTLHFQKLKSLTLYECILSSLINLPNRHLDYVKYLPKWFTRNGFADYQLTLYDKTYYSTLDPRFIYSEYANTPMDKKDRSLQQVMRPSGKVANVPYFHFRCASLKTAYFGHYYLLF